MYKYICSRLSYLKETGRKYLEVGALRSLTMHRTKHINKTKTWIEYNFLHFVGVRGHTANWNSLEMVWTEVRVSLLNARIRNKPSRWRCCWRWTYQWASKSSEWLIWPTSFNEQQSHLGNYASVNTWVISGGGSCYLGLWGVRVYGEECTWCSEDVDMIHYNMCLVERCSAMGL